MLDIQSLHHCYQQGKQSKVAIDDLSLKIDNGIIGLLGPNGAGKSSLMRILATITQPTRGNIYWQQQDIVKSPQALRQQLGYLPQYFGVYDQLTGVEFLTYIAGIKGIALKLAKQKIEQLLAMLNLSDVAHRPLSGYSGGMKQRIGIAQALLNDPQLLIIDEPTVGLDPQERNNFRQLLSELATDRCIIFSTHIVSDIETIADKIAIMQTGKVLIHDTPHNIQQKVANKCWTCEVELAEFTQLKQRYIISHSHKTANGLVCNFVAESCSIDNAVTRLPSLEDAYLYFTQPAPSATITRV